jgi:LysM repeat protein
MTTPNFYTVKPNDNLSGISLRTGVPVPELVALNGIKNPHHIRVGRKLALKREAICGVKVQILDRAHNPIRKLPYVLRYCGKEVKGETDDGGLIPPVVTDSPLDTVTVLLHRAEGDLKEVATVVSGYADKLVTLVSPKLKLVAKTFLHPVYDSQAVTASESPRPSGQNATKDSSAKSAGAASSTGIVQSWWGRAEEFLGIKVEEQTQPAGEPVAKVTNDDSEEPPVISEGKKHFTGAKICDADWTAAADKLGCEKEVIMAIAFQESGKLSSLGLGAFDKSHRPTILYERHIFHKFTGGKHDLDNPDISSKRMYSSGTAKDEHKVRYDDGNHYGLFTWQYRKLAKAYKLDANAALMACSWGKFQIMGFHFKTCGYTSVEEFVKACCISEHEHLHALEQFLVSARLTKALQDRDWPAIAAGYNGTGYRKNNYDVELEKGYDKYVLLRKNENSNPSKK